MNLKTDFLGCTLDNPLILGASPISHDVDKARRLADAGASAIVMYSLFEEQIVREQLAINRALDEPAEAFAEATSYLPEPEGLSIGPDRYLEQIRKLKRALPIPLIASLNGVSEGGWIKYAKLMEIAGADALELNTYNLATDPAVSGAEIETRTLQLVREVRKQVKIPLAVKISPFYTSLPQMAQRLADAGADAIVLFNRFYQPDIDVENLEVVRLQLSDSSELLLRLHWLAILYGRVSATLAVTGGVHVATDVVKSVMAGASGVQLVSSVLRGGPQALRTLLSDLKQWMEEHEYESLDQMRGSMSLLKAPDPAAYVRDNYMQVLASWRD
jgi:dihydroorotate dehydrogenase (fumarate)